MKDYTSIEVTDVVQTSFACPSQWNATTTDGEQVYVRYRHGRLTIDVDGIPFFTLDRDNDELDGLMSWNELERLAPIREV